MTIDSKLDFTVQFKASGYFKKKREYIADHTNYSGGAVDRFIYLLGIQAYDLITKDAFADEPSLEVQTFVNKMTPEQKAKLVKLLENETPSSVDNICSMHAQGQERQASVEWQKQGDSTISDLTKFPFMANYRLTDQDVAKLDMQATRDLRDNLEHNYRVTKRWWDSHLGRFARYDEVEI